MQAVADYRYFNEKRYVYTYSKETDLRAVINYDHSHLQFLLRH